VLASKIIRFLLSDQKTIVLYYFCSFSSSTGRTRSHILKLLITQLLNRSRDLASYVYEEYVAMGKTTSMLQLKDLIFALLQGFRITRIVVDGLDECDESDQKDIIEDLRRLAGVSPSGSICKILFVSRDISSISQHLRKMSSINLSFERTAIDSAIKSFVISKLDPVREKVLHMNLGSGLIDSISSEILEKADGELTTSQ